MDFLGGLHVITGSYKRDVKRAESEKKTRWPKEVREMQGHELRNVGSF